MKKTVLFAILSAVLSATLVAPQAQAQTAEGLEFCRLLGETAQAAVEARYRGVGLVQLLEIIRQEGMNDVLRAVNEAVIIDAFDLPAFVTPENRVRQALEYRAEVELACVTEMR